MNLRVLKMFVEVAQQGGFSRAVHTTNAAQPTISKAVKLIEDEFSIRVFERLADGVRLTDAGKVVYKRALRILAEFEALKAEVAALHGLEMGTLALGLPPVGSGILFSEHMARFHIRYPNITVQLQEAGCATLEKAVQNGKLELSLALLPVPQVFDWIEICDEPLVLLMPKDFPLKGRTQLSLNEIADSPFIWFERGFMLNERIEKICQSRGITLREAMRTGQVEFIITLVAAGIGVAVLPRLELEGRNLGKVQTALLHEESLRWHAAIIWRREGVLSPPAQAWLKMLQDFLQTQKTGDAAHCTAGQS